MIEVLVMTVCVALFAAWVLLLLTKWGVVEWLQVHGDDLVSRAASCSFCMSWLVCVALCVVALLADGDIRWAVVPFMATPITRMMV